MSGPTGRNLCMASLCIAAALAVSSSHAELTAEKIPNVAEISADYPESLIFAHDANFDALLVGRVVLLDVALETHNYLGALDAAQFASFTQSATRNELYVAETFYSRGTRGERTDAVTIYDKGHLTPIAEIALPGGKRGQMVSNRYTLQLVDNDRYLFLFNFTPAASVVMIDVESRTILSETPIPGCALIYPTGKRAQGNATFGIGAYVDCALHEERLTHCGKCSKWDFVCFPP